MVGAALGKGDVDSADFRVVENSSICVEFECKTRTCRCRTFPLGPYAPTVLLRFQYLC